MARRIEVTVPSKGLSEGKSSVRVEAHCYSGSGCTAATDIFKQALGTPTTEVIKDEYYDVELTTDNDVDA